MQTGQCPRETPFCSKHEARVTISQAVSINQIALRNKGRYNEVVMAKIEWNQVTWYSKLIALIIFVVFPFIGFYWGVGYGEMLQATTQGTTVALTGTASTVVTGNGQEYYGNVSEWQTVQSDNGRFSIAYPIDFPADDYYIATQGTDWRLNANNQAGVKYFTLTVPPAFEPQTNFADATLTVGASQNPTAVAQCLTPDQSGGAAMSTSTTAINGVQFTVFKFSDAGAGNYYETTSYRTIHGGQCYAVEYTIHSSQIANYPASYNLKPFDESQAATLLDRIVGTFTFLGHEQRQQDRRYRRPDSCRSFRRRPIFCFFEYKYQFACALKYPTFSYNTPNSGRCLCRNPTGKLGPG